MKKENVEPKYIVIWQDCAADDWAGAGYMTEKEAIEAAEEFILENGETGSVYLVCKTTHRVICGAKVEKL